MSSLGSFIGGNTKNPAGSDPTRPRMPDPAQHFKPQAISTQD
jgi:hypothetical protein